MAKKTFLDRVPPEYQYLNRFYTSVRIKYQTLKSVLYFEAFSHKMLYRLGDVKMSRPATIPI